MGIATSTPAKVTVYNATGERVATIHDTVGRLADAYKLDVFEVMWAIEEEGKCETDGLWPGQTAVIEMVEG